MLVTGFDIIFFWVARMMMMGLHFMEEIPFHTVYIHALVRDEKGAKMSKSKGNVIDPLELIDQYGADALRFTLAAMAAQGRDIKLSTQRVEGYRNFATKLWNAARFAEMNGCERVAGFDPAAVTLPLNRWALAEYGKAVRDVTAGIEAYRFNDAANAAYRFVWNVFCDWYLELAKPVFMGEDVAVKAETRASVAYVLDGIAKLLHPFMPYITEELWAIKGETGPARPETEKVLALASWPVLPAGRAGSRSRDRLAHRHGRRNPLSSRGNECSRRSADPACPRGRQRQIASPGKRLGRHAEAAREAVRRHLRRCRAAAVRATGRTRRGRRPAVGRHRRHRGRTGAADQGTPEDRGATWPRSTPSSATPTSWPARPQEVIEEQRERRDEAMSRGSKLKEALARLQAG